MEPQNNNYQTFFAAAGVAFDPLLPAGMTPSPLIVAPPPSRPAGVTRAHVEHPHHFGHAAPHGHSHAGHAPPSPPRVPLHSHHPGVVSHGHQVLTAHLKDKSRAEWREAERHDREQLVRERRGVRGIAEPRGSLGRQGAASHSGTPEQSFAPSSMRRASIAFPEPPVARPRERRLSLPAGFTFPEQLHSPVLSDERDAATLLGVDVPNTHPLHHDSLGRTKDTTKRAAELFRDSRHRAQDLARGLQGKDMEVDSDAGVMSVEFPAHGIQQVGGRGR